MGPSFRTPHHVCFLAPSSSPVHLPVYRRYVDFRLLPLLGALYGISLIDRSNLALAFLYVAPPIPPFIFYLVSLVSQAWTRTLASSLVQDTVSSPASFLCRTSCCQCYRCLCRAKLIDSNFRQVPSNALLRYFNPVYLLSAYILLWGGVQTGMGFVNSWEMLLMTRVLLGALEVNDLRFSPYIFSHCPQAGFFPGMVFIITTWYV